MSIVGMNVGFEDNLSEQRKTTLRRLTEALIFHGHQHTIEPDQSVLPLGELLWLGVILDSKRAVPVPFSVTDGAISLYTIKHGKRDKFCEMPVWKKWKQHFHFQPILDCIKAQARHEKVEEGRRARVRPFLEIARPFLMRTRRAQVTMDSDVDSSGLIHVAINGHFTVEELRALIKGVEESGVMNDEIVNQVMNS